MYWEFRKDIYAIYILYKAYGEKRIEIFRISMIIMQIIMAHANQWNLLFSMNQSKICTISWEVRICVIKLICLLPDLHSTAC